MLDSSVKPAAPPALTKYEKAKLAEENTRNDTWLQRMFLTWTYRVVGRGRSGKLKREELKMPANQATEVCQQAFSVAWEEQLKFVGGKGPKGRGPSLLRALIKVFGWEFVLAGCFKGAWSILVITGEWGGGDWRAGITLFFTGEGWGGACPW